MDKANTKSTKKSKTFTIKDPYSALTHFIGALLSIELIAPLAIKSSMHKSTMRTASLMVFIVSMIILYTASTVYHLFDISEKVNKTLRKIDHMCIYVLIAGTYTPICIVVLHNTTGYLLLTGIWILAIIGMVFNAFWITCPKWLSSSIYIIMGWLSMSISSYILKASKEAFYWLLAGGIIYTIGGVIYALKLPIFNKKHSAFGSHEVFHVFVMFGSACHYILMYQFVTKLPLH